jgi:predicted amidohydrolase
VSAPVGAPAPLGFEPDDPGLTYDLVVANGDVVDPVLRTRAKRDVGIRFGQIAAVAASIPPARALQRIDAAGKLVTPGMPLEEVVARATVEPGRVIGKVPGLGTLVVGAPADLAVFDLVDGPVDFVDTRNNRRAGARKLVPALTIRAGRAYGRPPLPVPFLY